MCIFFHWWIPVFRLMIYGLINDVYNGMLWNTKVEVFGIRTIVQKPVWDFFVACFNRKSEFEAFFELSLENREKSDNFMNKIRWVRTTDSQMLPVTLEKIDYSSLFAWKLPLFLSFFQMNLSIINSNPMNFIEKIAGCKISVNAQNWS